MSEDVRTHTPNSPAPIRRAEPRLEAEVLEVKPTKHPTAWEPTTPLPPLFWCAGNTRYSVRPTPLFRGSENSENPDRITTIT